MHIINMQNNSPAIVVADEEKCIRCLHCLAVCPSSAVSIAGFAPENSTPVTGNLPDDHIFGYAMVFGFPAVHYKRTSQRAPANIHRVENI